MRLVRILSRAVVIIVLPCGSPLVALAQAPGTVSGSYTILFRSQSTTGDFVAVSVDDPRTHEEIQQLVCEITGDERINIGASWTLQLRMYRGIAANQYIPRSYLRYVDDDSRAMFEIQEEQVLAAYYWMSPVVGESMARSLARSGWPTTPSIELMMDAQGVPIRPAELDDFDHTTACDAL